MTRYSGGLSSGLSCWVAALDKAIHNVRELEVKEIEQVQIALSVQLMGYRKQLYRNTRCISGHTQISGTRVRQTLGKWYRHTCTIIPRVGAVVMINVGLAQARPNKHVYQIRD